MKLLGINEIAERLGISRWTATEWLKEGKVPGRKLGNAWVATAREIYDYERGVEPDEISMAELMSTKDVADFLGLEVHMVWSMIEDGVISGTPIDARGTLAFKKSDVEKAKDVAKDYMAEGTGRPVKGNPDQYIYHFPEDGRYYIKGTRDHRGQAKSYSFLHSARRRAREAFEENDPLYEEGDGVEVFYEGDRHMATVLSSVTAICDTALVKLMGDGREVLADVDTMKTAEEIYEEMLEA